MHTSMATLHVNARVPLPTHSTTAANGRYTATSAKSSIPLYAAVLKRFTPADPLELDLDLVEILSAVLSDADQAEGMTAPR